MKRRKHSATFHWGARESVEFQAGATLLSSLAQGHGEQAHPGIALRCAQLTNVQMPLGCEVLPQWPAKVPKQPSHFRAAAPLLSVEEVLLRGLNLVAVVHGPKNAATVEAWQRFLRLVQTRFELDVENVHVKAGADGNPASLTIKSSCLHREMLTVDRSTGQLAWLAWSAPLGLQPNGPSCFHPRG